MSKPGLDNVFSYDSHGIGAFVEAVRLPGFPARYAFRPWRVNTRASGDIVRLSQVDYDKPEDADRVAFAYVQGPGEGISSARWDDNACCWDELEVSARRGRSRDSEDFHADG